MKTLWAFEPFHQDKERLQGMHSLLKQPELEERYVYRPCRIMAEVLAKAGIPLAVKSYAQPRCRC
jgi:hypothetical protein